MNKKVLLLLLLIVIFAAAFLILSIKTSDKNNLKNTMPTPPTGKANSGASTNNQDAVLAERGYLVGLLTNLTPYAGKNFSLFYDVRKDQFILYLNPAQKQSGETEFDNLLLKNNIQSRSWILNLFVTYIMPSPTPGGSTTASPTPAP